MAMFGVFPSYRTTADTGIEGDEMRFTVEVRVREETVTSGVARSKREAERRAAATAYELREQLAESRPADE